MRKRNDVLNILVSMTDRSASQLDPTQRSVNFDESQFFPKGAIAFFVGMLLFFAVIWLGVYALMIFRHTGL